VRVYPCSTACLCDYSSNNTVNQVQTIHSSMDTVQSSTMCYINIHVHLAGCSGTAAGPTFQCLTASGRVGMLLKACFRLSMACTRRRMTGKAAVAASLLKSSYVDQRLDIDAFRRLPKIPCHVCQTTICYTQGSSQCVRTNYLMLPFSCCHSFGNLVHALSLS
jgi:hypothetical protein